MQLVAYGAQDIYLTGNPQITFFKVVYRRHTNFSMEAIQQTVNGSATIGASSNSGTVTVSRNGDLVHNVYVRCNQDSTQGVLGDKLIDTVELEIGGQKIDKHTQEWLQVWAELSTPESKATGYKYLTGSFSNTLVTGGETNQQSIMVPLQFWFCRNPGLALPLIALQYHEVKMKFNWGTLSNVGRNATLTAAPVCEVWVDYIYLDTEERRRFAQQSHEYLIEQLQYISGSANTNFDLNFNHPVKELIWTDADSVTTQKAKLTLNGHDRFADQTREYFQVRQPMDHHTAVPGYNIKETENVTMLSSHLAAGAADLNSYITYAASTDKIVGGVVDIETAAGTNPVVGDVVKVIEKAPIMLSTPVDSGIEAHHSTTINQTTTVTLSATSLVYATGGSSIDTFTAGDIITIHYGGGDSAAAGDTFTHIATVTGKTGDTTVIFSPAWRANNLPGLADNDGLGVYIIGRLNNVEVGTGVVTAVAIAGTNFTLSNNSIVTKQDFKMQIVGRVQNAQSRCSQLSNNINVYSFALKPEEHQPSGTCNFSRIDTAKLQFSASATLANIYAVNYNVLRIMSGMGGLAYSN